MEMAVRNKNFVHSVSMGLFHEWAGTIAFSALPPLNPALLTATSLTGVKLQLPGLQISSQTVTSVVTGNDFQTSASNLQQCAWMPRPTGYRGAEPYDSSLRLY